MLKIFENLFGLIFVEIAGDERSEFAKSGNGTGLVWHEEVQLFGVWDSEDEGGGFLGYLYLDLYSRKNKYSNPSNWNLQPVKFRRSSGTIPKLTSIRALFTRTEPAITHLQS